MTTLAKKVFKALSDGSAYWKEISDKTGLNRMEVFSGLLELELLGLIRQHAGKRFTVN